MNENGNFPHIQVPTNNDLARVRSLIEHKAMLTEQLIQTEEALKEAWKKLPYDPEIEKKPSRSDIPARCRNCNKPTKWRSPKGYALHYNKDMVPECPPDRIGRTTPGISQEIWDILDMPDDQFAELDSDEILEIIAKSNEDKKNE